MSIELFQLNASVSSGVVTLTWSQPPGQALGTVTSYAIQRKQFGYGQDNWTTLATQAPATAPTANSYQDTPATPGDWSYRVQATVTQGGVDNAGTQISSIEVNVTTEATTGAVTLVLGSQPAGDPAGYTRVKLGWYITGNAVDVDHWVIQRSINGGTFRDAERIAEHNAPAFEEVLQNGTGTVTYQVLAKLPSATPPYNAWVVSTSNQVSVTF